MIPNLVTEAGLEIREVPQPKPKANEVLVRVRATGLRVDHPVRHALPQGVTLVAEPEALVLHVLAAPTAEQIEAELGETPAAEEAEAVPEAVPDAAEAADESSG